MPYSAPSNTGAGAPSVRVGIVGAGYFGGRHAVRYGELSNAEVVAICDIRADSARRLAHEVGAMSTTDYREIVPLVDCISIATPPESHFELAQFFLEHGVHVLVEKPICDTVEQADILIERAARKGLVLNVGHVERFNPAFVALTKKLDCPRLIESRRLVPIEPRRTHVSVVLDLMIHDIDLILMALDDTVCHVQVDAQNCDTEACNHASARLEFSRGTKALVVASRFSAHAERKMRVIQDELALEADFLEGTLSVFESSGQLDRRDNRATKIETQRFGPNSALLAQIDTFVRSIEQGTICDQSATSARNALEVALAVTNLIQLGHTQNRLVASVA